ncbi:hypothetical protein [Reyranella sp.]|jgi:hypothetical protein|uniref:hypothetical protein n=1 Tax=Reyranella sp. TaxID=1929291 RepID=UPI002F92CDC9
MDRMVLERHLAQAEEHVALAEALVMRQRRIVAELERDHHRTAIDARRMLAQFEAMQKEHAATRDMIAGELAAAQRKPAGPAR